MIFSNPNGSGVYSFLMKERSSVDRTFLTIHEKSIQEGRSLELIILDHHTNEYLMSLCDDPYFRVFKATGHFYLVEPPDITIWGQHFLERETSTLKKAEVKVKDVP